MNEPELIDKLRNGKTKEVARVGFCRVWTGLALDEIEKWSTTNKVEVIAEAREVNISHGLDHTFVRLEIGGKTYFLDGTGVEKFPPYFGLASTAPSHLLNSHIDTWIMSDRRSRI